MDTTQRQEVRTSLTTLGFTRTAFTDDHEGTGDYTETWTHTASGATVDLNWSTYPDLPGENKWAQSFRALRASADRRAPISPAQDLSGSITPGNMANVQAQVTGLPAAHNDEGSTSALGMYDEPDHGLDFNSTLRRNEGL